MWGFIKYCLYCLGIMISASFGNNPEGMSLKSVTIGAITMIVLIGLLFLVIYLISLIINHFR